MFGDGRNGVGAAVVSGGLALRLLSLDAARLVLSQAAGSVSLLIIIKGIAFTSSTE